MNTSALTNASQKNYSYRSADPRELIALDVRLAHAVVDCLQGMAENQEKIINDHWRSKDKKYLTGGVWYPRDYIHSLRTEDPQGMGEKRYQWLRNRQHLSLGYLDSHHFDPILDGPKRRAWHFRVKQNSLPSDALKTAIQGLSILDCGAAIQIARYKALLDILGDDKFNRLFQGIMNIGYQDDDLQPMRYFVDFTRNAKEQPLNKNIRGTIGKRLIEVGNVVSMDGVPSYSLKHPGGMSSNFNVVCSDPTFRRS